VLTRALIFAFLAVGRVGLAQRDTPEGDREWQAQRAMERGVKARSRGDLASALAAYEEAQRLVPEANLPYRFGAEVLEAMGRWEPAVRSYQRYLEIKPGVSDAAKVRDKIAELRALHLDGIVDVSCQPAGARVFLDGGREPIGTTPLQGFVATAGAHRLRIAAEGFHDAELEAPITAGGRLRLQCALERDAPPPSPPTLIAPTPVAPTPVAPPPPVMAQPRRWYRHWAFWTGVGVTAAAVAVGVGVGVGMTAPPSTEGGTHHFP
jgi:tetratricopeptide (TPR) repeat protein